MPGNSQLGQKTHNMSSYYARVTVTKPKNVSCMGIISRAIKETSCRTPSNEQFVEVESSQLTEASAVFNAYYGYIKDAADQGVARSGTSATNPNECTPNATSRRNQKTCPTPTTRGASWAFCLSANPLPVSHIPMPYK